MLLKEFLDNGVGSAIISIILGLGLAALFQKACNDNNCVIIKGPSYKDIKDKIYIHDSKCYTYKPESATCPGKKPKITT
jgi:hypothetical protein